jgi:hypothetical protein
MLYPFEAITLRLLLQFVKHLNVYRNKLFIHTMTSLFVISDVLYIMLHQPFSKCFFVTRGIMNNVSIF